MNAAAALEALLKVSSEARKTAGLRLLRRSITERCRFDTNAGPGRLFLEVILATASTAWVLNRSVANRLQAAEALEWWSHEETFGPWFELLDLDPAPTVSLFFKLLPHLSIDKEVLKIWAEIATTARARALACSLLTSTSQGSRAI